MTNLPIRVNVFVYRRNNTNIEFLCVKRVPNDGGFWQTITGTVHENEAHTDTVVREIKEECGIANEDVLSVEGPFYNFEWIKNNVTIQEFVYMAEVRDVPIVLSPDEHDDYVWCDKEMLTQRLEKEENINAANKIIQKLYA